MSNCCNCPVCVGVNGDDIVRFKTIVQVMKGLSGNVREKNVQVFDPIKLQHVLPD